MQSNKLKTFVDFLLTFLLPSILFYFQFIHSINKHLKIGSSICINHYSTMMNAVINTETELKEHRVLNLYSM